MIIDLAHERAIRMTLSAIAEIRAIRDRAVTHITAHTNATRSRIDEKLASIQRDVEHLRPSDSEPPQDGEAA